MRTGQVWLLLLAGTVAGACADDPSGPAIRETMRGPNPAGVFGKAEHWINIWNRIGSNLRHLHFCRFHNDGHHGGL
jgi:hypothetical protein